MEAEDKIYRDLQKYLNEKTLGFPAAESGADIRLLKTLFTPELAKATMTLTHKFESVAQIYERSNKEEFTIDELEDTLYEAAGKGLIHFRKRDGKKEFKNIPYLIGFVEGQLDNLTPEFRTASSEYGPAFGPAFLSTKVAQMRIIPVEKSLTPEHTVSNYDEIKDLVAKAHGPIAILECICRKGSALNGNPCQKTSRKETCMGFEDIAETILEFGKGRQISKDEALDILRQNAEDGLVFQPSNAQEPEFICSCCGCCCGILNVQKIMPRPTDFWKSNFQAHVDPDACSGCETCIDTCQVNAMEFDDDQGVASVNLDRCVGCGLCVTTCPDEAIELIKKDIEIVPPRTTDDLYDTIMDNKRGI
jgi:Pyruvate/2-oxoacid:ferredoxin oxidoreductase delta subunit